MDFSEILKGAHAVARGETPVAPVVEAEPIAVATTGEETQVAAAEGSAQPIAPVADEDGEPPVPDEHGRVPLDALKSERAKRQDWKTKATQFEERHRAALAEIAELKKAAPAAPVVQPQTPVTVTPPAPVHVPVPPNAVEDPEGFAQFHREQAQQQRLYASEVALRQAHGDAEVEAKLAVFTKAAKANPSLLAQANAQPHPWGWMYQQAQKLEKLAEVGDDPDAYRAKIRAEVEAELRAGAPTPTIDLTAPVVNTHRPAPSLAAARSAAPGKAPAAAWSGPVPFDGMVGRNAVSARR